MVSLLPAIAQLLKRLARSIKRLDVGFRICKVTLCRIRVGGEGVETGRGGGGEQAEKELENACGQQHLPFHVSGFGSGVSAFGFPNSGFRIRVCEYGCMVSGLGLRDVGCGLLGVGCGVWGVGCGVYGVGCGV